MVILLQILGVFIALMGLLGLFAPAKLVGVVAALFDGIAGLWIAAGIRLAIGVLMVLTAPQSRFPLAFWLIGLFAIVAAIVGVLMGKDRVRALVLWWVEKPAGFTRLWSIVAIAFGLFIYYGLS